MSVPEIRIGTSGWHYGHWRGTFYPREVAPSEMFAYYRLWFDTVEINNSFYRLPTLAAAAAWRAAAPARFKFALKASRYITHMKKLADPKSALERFFPVVEALGPRRGPVLFQLPPHWPVDLARLDAFLGQLPRKHRYALELRDPSWLRDDVYAILRQHNAAFCAYELGGFNSPRIVTSDFAYVRLHGPEGKYAGSYSDAALRKWADQIDEWARTLRAIYVYFDNDQAGYAPKNAIRLKELVGEIVGRSASSARHRRGHVASPSTSP